MTSGIVIAIDGPAGAGKSSVSKALAETLGLARLDTGSMYRSLTWLALERGIDAADGEKLAALATSMDLTVGPDGVVIDGVLREREIRTPDVSSAVSAVSAHPAVRRVMVARQQELAKARGAVIEGRDIGRVVAPDADLKVFLTATARDRATRRLAELHEAGHEADLETLEREIVERDERDARTTPLEPADGAVVVDSSGKTLEEVVEEIAELARSAGYGAR